MDMYRIIWLWLLWSHEPNLPRPIATMCTSILSSPPKVKMSGSQ